MRKQMVAGASATGLTSTAPPPTGFFLPSHLLTRYVLSNVFVFASSWIRGPELLTARSALACVPVPRGEFLWDVMDWTLPSDLEGRECDLTTQSQFWSLTFCTWPRMFRRGQKLLILSCLKPLLSNIVYISHIEKYMYVTHWPNVLRSGS